MRVAEAEVVVMCANYDHLVPQLRIGAFEKAEDVAGLRDLPDYVDPHLRLRAGDGKGMRPLVGDEDLVVTQRAFRRSEELLDPRTLYCGGENSAVNLGALGLAEDGEIVRLVVERSGDQQDARRAVIPRGHRLRGEDRVGTKL